MKYPKECQLRRVVDPSAVRYNGMRHILCEYEGHGHGTLVATDGAALAIVPCEMGPDEHAGLISADALQWGNGELVLSLSDLKTGKFPDWRSRLSSPGSCACSIIVSAARLCNLLNAIGCKDTPVVIHIPLDTTRNPVTNAPILIEPYYADANDKPERIPFGMLMAIEPSTNAKRVLPKTCE